MRGTHKGFSFLNLMSSAVQPKKAVEDSGFLLQHARRRKSLCEATANSEIRLRK
jgi:hypothetical protein